MGLADSIRVLNNLKRRRVIRDYALIGSVAATSYMEPIFTEDLDIVVLVNTDEEFQQLFLQVTSYSDGMEGMHHVLGGVLVQLFPTTIKPLYEDTLHDARRARVGNLRVKVASPEHLVLLALEAFRERDRFRITALRPSVDERKLNGLLRRFDETGTLTSRLQTLR
ncbi:MAG: hypothetical protein BZY88_00990 [SAR202 cluster bacterium Io17-Chloro-G9]|nr:MAG: hypothetical protein BZY88_00990 [SAR202 cluster bacterium Io17-Chloro-G9]